jgi:hypothetical protein
MSRFFKQVVSLSKTPEDFKKAESVPPTKSVPSTETQRAAVLRLNTDSIPPTDTAAARSKYSRPKPRLARVAQDGHSHAEQSVYAALWDGGSPDADGNRTITIGLGRLSRVARLSENNCRLNARSLVRKLAIEEIGEENSRACIGKTYRVFSYSAILQRRKAAGLEWVLRTKGVAFVTPDGNPIDDSNRVVSVPHTGSIPGTETIPGPPTESGPGPPTESVPPYRNLFRKEFEERKTSPSLIEQTAHKHGIILDDDIVCRIQKNCKLNEPSATEQEIAYMLDLKINQLKFSRSIENLPAVLVKAVANLFPSNELQRYRTKRTREQAESRASARQILDDPNSTEKDREWAQAALD